MAAELIQPDPDDAEPAADVQPPPSEADQDLLDYAHGANLELPGLIDYIKMNGALAGMVERQSRAIAAAQLEIQTLRANLKLAQRRAGGGGGP